MHQTPFLIVGCYLKIFTTFLPQGFLVLGGDFNCFESVIDRLNIKSDFGIDK